MFNNFYENKNIYDSPQKEMTDDFEFKLQIDE